MSNEDLAFLDYARLMAERGARAYGGTLTFDELVASSLTEAEVLAAYGEETAINVGIARDPDAMEWTGGSRGPTYHVSQTNPELWEAYVRGFLRVRPDLLAHAGTSPGEYLRAALLARGMSQRRLAVEMGRPIQNINAVVTGKKALTPRTALELERVLGIPADYWVRLEAEYRLALERAAAASALGVGVSP